MKEEKKREKALVEQRDARRSKNNERKAKREKKNADRMMGVGIKRATDETVEKKEKVVEGGKKKK
jgi:hypothetical protein